MIIKADIVASLAAAIGIGLSVVGSRFGIIILLYADIVTSVFCSLPYLHYC